MTASPSALPSNLSIITWNGDHLLVASAAEGFDRRNAKLRMVDSLLAKAPDVLFIQEPGRIFPSFAEWCLRRGYRLFFAQSIDGKAGVASLVKLETQRKYSFVHDIVVQGQIAVLRSTRQLSFLLINTHFSPYGEQFRHKQYVTLSGYLRSYPSFAVLLGGDQNRIDEKRQKFHLARGDVAGHWGEPDKKDSGLFQQLVSAPAKISRICSDHLGFQHRSGRYIAELDAFFADDSMSQRQLFDQTVTPILQEGCRLSDHDPLHFKRTPKGKASGRLADWVCKDPAFPDLFVRHLNALASEHVDFDLVLKTEEGWTRNPLFPDSLIPQEMDWQGIAARKAAKDVKAMRSQVEGVGSAGVILGFVRLWTDGLRTGPKLEKHLRRNPVLYKWVKPTGHLVTGMITWSADLAAMKAFSGKALEVVSSNIPKAKTRLGQTGILSKLQARKSGLVLYQLSTGEVVQVAEQTPVVAGDIKVSWSGNWKGRDLTLEQKLLRQASLFPIAGSVSEHEPRYGFDQERIRESWKGRSSVPGPNGEPWSLPRALPFYYSSCIAAQGRFLLEGNVIRDYNIHDLYFIGKKPVMTAFGPAYSSDTVRDISVGNWQLRSLEEEAVAPIAVIADQILHPANVGWVKGRLINQPITKANRAIYWARIKARPFACLLLDFLKAFPSVLLPSMWEVLSAQGWRRDYIVLLRSLHQDMRQTMRIHGQSFEGPPKFAGLWTGSGASCILLLCLLDVLLRELYRHACFDWEDSTSGKVDGFADDLTAFVHTPHQLYVFRSIVSAFGEWSGVVPSLSKTVLIIPNYEEHRIQVWKAACWPEVQVVSAGETLGLTVGANLN